MQLNRRCLLCDREIGWLARQIHEHFCSSDCSAKYRDRITHLALERLNAAEQASEEALAPLRAD